MKILHVITKLNEMYGAQRHAVECIKDHLVHGHVCMVITGEDGIASNIVTDKGVKVSKVSSLKNSYNPLTCLKALSQIGAIICNFKPDLVISHSSIGGIITRIACYKKKVPNIFTVQGWPFEIGTKWYQRLAGIAIETLLKRYSDSYLCVSQYTANYGIKILGFKDTRRIYVCANMHVNKEYRLPLSFKIYKNVLMVAGFRGQKDHITALKAMEIVMRDNKVTGLKLTLVGDGPNRKEIEDFIQKRNLQRHVILAGETTNVDEYYDHCDIVILPTYYEGLPLSLLEAIQKAKPIIATNVGGINEIVDENKNGNLLQVADHSALANYIVAYYVDNKLQLLSIQSRKIYDERFSYNKISERLNLIIEEAVRFSIFSGS